MKKLITILAILLSLSAFSQRANTRKIYVVTGETGTGGTVISVGLTVPTGFTVTGSPITTAGTFGINYASGYSLPTTSSQTAWNDAYSWGNHALFGYQTGTESYISDVSFNANTLTFTGVGSAFNSTIGNIAQTNYYNTFSVVTPQYIITASNPYSLGNGIKSLANIDALFVGNAAGTERFSIKGDGKIYMKSLTSATKSNILYIDPTTKEITEGAAPTAGGTDLSFSGASSPVTLNSSSGTDVTFTAGTGIGLSSTSGNLTITNTSTNTDNQLLSFSSPNLSISGGNSVNLSALAAAAGWTKTGTYISQTTLTDQVRIGSATDLGGYIFQVTGDTRHSGAISATDFIYAENGLQTAAIATPTGRDNVFYAKSDNKAYFNNANDVEFDLTNVVEPFRTISSTGTTALATTDKIVFVTGSGATITYPTVPAGKVYTIKNSTSGNINVPTYATMTGPTSLSTIAGYDCKTFLYNGSGWYEIK